MIPNVKPERNGLGRMLQDYTSDMVSLRLPINKVTYNTYKLFYKVISICKRISTQINYTL